MVRGPMVGADHAFVAVEQWLGPRPRPLTRDESLARLARRYLTGHAPAEPADLAKWAGIPLGDARAAFVAVDDELVPVGDGLVALEARQEASRPEPRLLGAFDPLLLGWASRDPFVGRHSAVVTTNGIFRPSALVGGRVAATWSLPGGRVTVELLDPISGRARRSLEQDGADVLRFLGMAQTPVRFS
jgi:hypothetical protein